MGPGVKVDPLSMLTEAKRVCDTLVSVFIPYFATEFIKKGVLQLANPSQLVSQPPPQIFSTVPTFYPASTAVPMASSSTATASSSKPSSAPVISNPQSFVVPLTAQTAYPHAQYPIYAPGQYPTTPYYHQYYPGTYYPQPVPSSQPQPVATTATVAPTPTPTPSVSTNNASSSVGAWSDEETERLKKLAEDSKAVGTSGDIEWDWVVHQWGNTRTRYLQKIFQLSCTGL